MRLLGDWLESNSRKSGSKIILAADVAGPFEDRLERASSLISSTEGEHRRYQAALVPAPTFRGARSQGDSSSSATTQTCP